jgi:hypothetical protein
MAMKTYKGSCHCGAITFEADLDLSRGTLRCNCSLCRKARAWFAFTPPDHLRVTKGGDGGTEYAWTPPKRERPNIHYHFCPTCGVRTFARADNDGRGNPGIAVNVAALDDADLAELEGTIRYVDGLHDHFDRKPEHAEAL